MTNDSHPASIPFAHQQAYLTDVKYGKGKPSYEPAFSTVHHNFIIANYGGSQVQLFPRSQRINR
jgi:hypothetical protein